ncbi:hypothetical protein RhiirB3_382210, partial [Rhizophagus irregularis]
EIGYNESHRELVITNPIGKSVLKLETGIPKFQNTELTERLRRPSRRFETDEMSQKEPSRRFRTDETSRKVHQLRSLDLDFRSVMISTIGSLEFGSVTVNFEKHYQLLIPIFKIKSVTVPLSLILDLD